MLREALSLIGVLLLVLAVIIQVRGCTSSEDRSKELEDYYGTLEKPIKEKSEWVVCLEGHVYSNTFVHRGLTPIFEYDPTLGFSVPKRCS